MKINLKDIGKISKLSQIKKYKKKNLFYNNYLFHYLILTDNLQGLKLTKYPVYKLDNNGLNGFHIAAQNNYFKILQYLIKTYPDYIYNLSSEKSNFMMYLDFNDNSFLDFIIKNNLDWNELLNRSTDDDTCMDIIFNISNKKTILTILKQTNINLKEYKLVPSFFHMLLNTKLNMKDKIEILDELEKKYPDLYNIRMLNNGANILWESIKTNELKLIKYICDKMKKNKIEIDQIMPVYGYSIFRTVYSTDGDNDNYNISNFIWDEIKDNVDFTKTNMFRDNLAHFIINNRIEKGIGDYDLEIKILSKCNEWNFQNIEKQTPLHYLLELNDSFDKYFKVLKNKKIDLTIKNEHNETVLDIASKKWKNFLLKLPKYKEPKNEVKMLCSNCEYKHGNLFSATFIDVSILFYHLEKKYSELYIPKYIKNVIQNINYDNGLKLPDKFLDEYLNFPWLIFWERGGKHWIHPYLNQLINSVRRDGKYDYACIMLSMRLLTGGLHATILIYDFKRNSIERFDPYGDTTLIDDNIDDILEEELTWNTGLNYVRPFEYLPTSSFQLISNENNGYNQKSGDFGGYCAAWCLWYLEHKIKNSKIDSKELVKKTLKKLVKMDISFSEYIRNYANNINKEKISILKKIGIPDKRISDKHIITAHENMIYDFIYENM
jgi:hypothetical protein